MRTAILGGSFNPIHFGHLLVADEVLEFCGLDRVVFVPVGVPPHKTVSSLAPAPDRYAMVSLAIASNPRFQVSDLEVRRRAPSYTTDTLAALATPGDTLFCVIGSETFLDLLSWREPHRVPALARLVVVPRAGVPFDPDSPAARKVLDEIGLTRFVTPDAGPAPADAVLLVHATSLPLSASEIRERVRAGRSIAYRVPDTVASYIAGHALYGEAPSDAA